MAFKIMLAAERGMCQGVDRAIRTVEMAVDHYGDKVWVLHEVVHNQHVVADLKARGAHFAETLNEIPDGAVLIFSAHGVGLDVEKAAAARDFIKIIDATCPVVSGIHRKVNRASAQNKEVVIIGHYGHQEVVGTINQYSGDPSKIHVILSEQDVESLNLDGGNAIFATQTTLSVEETARTVAALRAKYPEIEGPRQDDTCNATQSRQNAVRELASVCDLVIIAGSSNSSNSNRLREVAAKEGVEAYLIEDYSFIKKEWLAKASCIGVSSGASAPEYLVKGIVDYLMKNGGTGVSLLGEQKEMHPFPLPKNI